MNRIGRIAILVVLATVGCTVSPVLTDAQGDGHGAGRYSDCRRAARDLCRYQESADDARKQCVAEATYKCVTGSGE